MTTAPGSSRRVPRYDVVLRCPEPYDATSLFAFLGARAIPGVEHWDGTTYQRSVRLPNGAAVVALTPTDGCVECALRSVATSSEAGGRSPRRLEAEIFIARLRDLLDLGTDGSMIDNALGADPALAPLVASRPGIRVPGILDGDELAVRAVLGQQVSVASARTHAARLVTDVGEPLAEPDGPVTHLFPTVAAIASIDPARLAMPKARQRALIGLCSALASGRIVIDASADRERIVAELLALPGIGPWTVAYICLRALGDRDVFMPTDLGVRRGLERLGLEGDPNSAARRAERWRPWRSYALVHLWASLAT